MNPTKQYGCIGCHALHASEVEAEECCEPHYVERWVCRTCGSGHMLQAKEGEAMKLLCWLLGHRWDGANPQSIRGRAGVRRYCMRCRAEDYS
jgi:hypothetical protein